jgi:hypothetical protein
VDLGRYRDRVIRIDAFQGDGWTWAIGDMGSGKMPWNGWSSAAGS